MKKLFCIISAAILSLSIASAQEYPWAIGIRGGAATGGLTVKYSIDGVNAIEGMLSGMWDNGFLVTALYERHIPVISQGFHFYYGAGGHLGSWKDDFAIGVDGVIGLEYKIPSIPLALSLDYKPLFNIASDTKFILDDFGLGIKVTF